MKKLHYILPGIILLLIVEVILLIIPFSQNKFTKSYATVQDNFPNASNDSCGYLSTGYIVESPVCTSPIDTSSYGTTILVHSSFPGTLDVTLHWDRFWCNHSIASGQHCLDNPNPYQETHTFTPGNNEYEFRAPNTNKSCGVFQNDFWFTYSLNGKSCYSQQNGSSTPLYNAWGWCYTKNPNCSPTPTPTSTPTITPSMTPTPTVTVTPTAVLTPTATQTPTPTSGVCTTPPTCQTPPAGCSFEGQDSCSCGNLICVTQIPNCAGSNCETTVNITNNNNQSQTQQQQQQQVLGAVAPAPQATSLPGTGADTEVVFGLISLLGVGIKLRSKFI